MPQFIKANICFRESLVPGAVPVAAQTLHTAKSDILNHLNLSQAAAGDSTWHLTLFTHECVWGILQIPQPLGNASNPERFWMMPFLLGLDGAWFTASLHVRSSSINHTWLSLSEGVKSYQELFISLLDLSQWFFVFVRCEAMLIFQKPHWTPLTTLHYAALKAKVVLPGLSEFTLSEATVVKEMHTTGLWRTATPRANMSSYFWAWHSRGMWHIRVKHRPECMRKLITRREKADAVYLDFLPCGHWIAQPYK